MIEDKSMSKTWMEKNSTEIKDHRKNDVNMD